MSDYELPKVWKWEDENDKLSGNRPDAGSRFDQKLPVGDAPFQLYSMGTPNGIKIPIMFEELKEAGTDVDYDVYKIDITEGDQFGSDFVEINPNSKIPALVDYSNDERVDIFESASILLYLAEKFDKLIPADIKGRAETMNWLFWQIGSAPYVGGGFGHFFNSAPEPMKYPIDRFTMETKRQLDLLDKTLAERTYITGEEFTIADIAIWSWYGQLVLGDLYKGSAEFLNAESYTNLMDYAKRVADRPAVKRGLDVNYQPISK